MFGLYFYYIRDPTPHISFPFELLHVTYYFFCYGRTKRRNAMKARRGPTPNISFPWNENYKNYVRVGEALLSLPTRPWRTAHGSLRVGFGTRKRPSTPTPGKIPGPIRQNGRRDALCEGPRPPPTGGRQRFPE